MSRKFVLLYPKIQFFAYENASGIAEQRLRTAHGNLTAA